jgi:PAS domain S-box-containing protein
MTKETRLRVLLVEDDPADAELVLHELKRSDFDVVSTAVGTRGQLEEALRDPAYDVVLSDYNLSGWNGMGVLEELRSRGLHIPLILVTGTLGDERAVDCVKAGIADYVLKPNLARLPMAIRRALAEQEAEAELRERKDRFRQLADNIAEVFYIVDAEFRETLYINQAYDRIFGRSRATLYEHPRAFLDPVHPDDRPLLMDNIVRLQRGESPGQVEFRVVHPDGSIRWVLSHAIPIRNERGAVYRLSGVAMDVTETKQAEAALRQAGERFRLLTEASFDAISVSERGVLREVNRGFLELFGFEREADLVGRSLFDVVAPESRDEVKRRVDQDLSGSYEIVGLRADGKRLNLEVTARTMQMGDGTVRITALRNVTEKRLLEDQFRQAQKMEAIGRLAGGVAHDFNNLLTVITGHTEFLLAEMTPTDPRREDLESVRKAAEGAAALTRQLLTFSRHQVIEARPVSLTDVVAGAKKLLLRLIGEDVDLETHLTQQPTTIFIDPGHLEQVLMNLVVNARDAMPVGGKLTIETSIVHLDEDSAQRHWRTRAGSFAVLSVSDNGVGMAAETRERIFEPFFTTKEPGKGTGLGLATVYGIVKQGGGFIDVYSELSMGTTFKVYFPLVGSEPTTEIDRHDAQHAATGTETVLLVEDAPPVRQIARRILERHGYMVLETDSAIDGLAMAQRKDVVIHLLLTDVVMPQMSGRVLAERFSALHPEAKVIFMSGYTDDAIVRHGVLEAGTPYLQKPFTPFTLAAKVREVLDA